MTRKKGNQTVHAQTAHQSKRWSAQDSFANFEARVGIRTDNQTSQSSYQFDFISRNRIQLEAMYRSSWVVGQAVDVIADDMTRAGLDVTAGLDAEQKTKLNSAMERLFIWDKINDGVKWGRLYGGAVAFIMIKGQKPETELRPETVSPGQFKGLFVMDRWQIQPTLQQLIKDYGPDMGLPMYYDVIADGLALQRQRIHHSRIIRFDGVTLPYWQGFTESLWGQSIIERIYDRLVAFDSTTAGVAQLVYKAHLRTLTVEGLRTILAAGGSAEAALIKNVDMIRRFQSNEGLTLIDGKDKLDSSSYTFTGLDAVLLQFGQQLSGATGIPLVRLFGQSPSGMSATGESDIRNYYDNIKQGQERKLRNPMTVLLDLMCRSELNVEPPEDLAFSFNPLWQMSDTEKAEIAVKVTTAVTAANEAGLISDQAAMQELRDSAEITGVFANITDEQIKNADDQPPEPAPPEPNPGSEGPENSERAGAAGTQSGERVREAVA